MKIHHLNCGTMCPFAGRLLHETGPYLGRAHLVCHCLLLETRNGLVLVDSGLGLKDVRREDHRVDTAFVQLVRPKLLEDETALRQVQALGFQPEDVRHVVLTHLDVDHAGGISDFPWATVHVMAKEHESANSPRTRMEGYRYHPDQWRHGVRWNLLTADGETWNGFAAARELPGLESDVLLIPLEGHTRGHAGVAVNTGDGWLLHAGDSYFFEGEMNVTDPHCSVGFQVFQTMMAVNNRLRRENQERLRDLKRRHDDTVHIFCGHSDTEFESLRSGLARA